MRIGAIAVFALLCTSIRAQMKIEGCDVCLDPLTGTLLATVPESMFGHDALLQVETTQGWRQASIGGTEINGGTFLFSDISAERKWDVALTAADGTQRQATLQFTFLPIVRLLPPEGEDFGYDYKEGMVLFTHPDSLRTDTLTARIKWRGGTTNVANKHKRNYKLNFDDDHRFFGLRNDDKWMLDAGQPDVFRMRNRIAMDVWNRMARKPYYADKEPKALNGVRGEMVEVFLGTEWRGIYNFSELMDRKQMKLKKTDSTTGEIHGCMYKAVGWEKTKMFEDIDSFDNTSETLYDFEMEYPDLEDSDTVDWEPLVSAINFAGTKDNQEFQSHIGDYFDIPLVIDYNIFYNVVNAVDNGGKNMYWAVYDKAQAKRLTPTPWDLDATFGQRWGGNLIAEVDEGFYNSPEFRYDLELRLTYCFFKYNFNDYIGQLNERYRELRQPGQPLHTDSILAVVEGYYKAMKNSGAATREEAKWSGDSDVWGDVIDFDTEYAYICDWIRRRMEFIDQTELPLFYKKSYFDELAVQSPSLATGSHDAVYDLSGRRISTNGTSLKPGLYIRGGKKIIMR